MTDRKHPDAHCENCEWNIDEAGFADAVGPKDADLIMIGETPGKYETKTGEIFSGPVGHLLDKTLEQYGMDRSKIRLTNAVACHPPYENLDGGSTEPPKSVVQACRPRLMKELEGRSTALCMGNTARRSVLDDWKTGILKGRQEPPIDLNGVDVVSSIHPAYCLRNPDGFLSFLKDINKFKSIADGISVFTTYEPPMVAWYDDIENAEKVLKRLMEQADILAVDIETGVEKDRDFTHPNEWLSIGFGYADNKAVVLGTECLKDRKIQEMIGELLSSKKLILHNGKYDLQVLVRIGILEPESFYIYADTMLASYVLDERPGNHGLKVLSSERLGAPDYEHEVRKYVKRGESYANIPRKVLYKYNGYDCVFTWHLWKIFEEEIGFSSESKLRQLHDNLCSLATELIYVELDGVTIDQRHLDGLTDEYIELLEAMDKEFYERFGVENIRSVPQVKNKLAKLEIPVGSTQADELDRARELLPTGTEAREFLDLLLEQRKQAKLYGTYIKGTRKRLIDGRVYPTYLLHGTTSGRLACKNPNVQNVPRNSSIKKLYVPQPGNIFVQCDFGQAELRTIAILAQDPYLKEVFENIERDIHGEVADTLFGAGNWNKEDRVRAKSYVFGSIYGLSPYSIALDYGISEMQAFKEQQAFFKMIPATMKWRRQVIRSVVKDGQFLETPFGRQRRFRLITRENKSKLEKEILAYLPQSTASDVTLASIIAIRKRFGYGPGVPGIRNTVHDSIMVECEESIKDDVANEMTKIMVDTASELLGDYVPFTSDAEYGQSWGELLDA